MARNKRLSILLLCLAFVVLVSFLYINIGTPLFGSSPYNTYTLQALAWREGRTYLMEDVPHLELAIYEDKYFVSFPPVPSVPIYLLTFIFGERVPDNLLVLLYAFVSLTVLWKMLERKGFPPFHAAAYAFLILLASSFLPLILQGAVWYQAQVLAMMLTLLAIDWMDRDKPTLGLLAYALAVGCRPFNALYGPLLFILYFIKHKDTESFQTLIKKLVPGIILGLLVAACYAAYNYLRFDNPLEFGHNHLPEFSFQGGTQFSFSHIGKNAREFLLGLPFTKSGSGWQLKIFGFSMLIANPALLIMLVGAIVLAIMKKMTIQHLMILLFFFVHLLLLLMHRTFGGYQYGARYAADLLPYAALFLMSGVRRKMTIAEAAIYLLGLALAVYGSLMIHL